MKNCAIKICSLLALQTVTYKNSAWWISLQWCVWETCDQNSGQFGNITKQYDFKTNKWGLQINVETGPLKFNTSLSLRIHHSSIFSMQHVCHVNLSLIAHKSPVVQWLRKSIWISNCSGHDFNYCWEKSQVFFSSVRMTMQNNYTTLKFYHHTSHHIAITSPFSFQVPAICRTFFIWS